MRIETHGHQIDVTPALREYVESKLGGCPGTSTASTSRSARS